MQSQRNLSAQTNAYFELLVAWTSRIIRARYQQSILGGLWAVIQPAATVAVFTLLFTYFIPIDTGNIPYAVFSYSAMVPWIFLTTAITDMGEALVLNMNLVTKIYFPREIFVISGLLARLFDFMIAYLVLIVLVALYRLPISMSTWIFLPLILVIQMALMLGIGMVGAALNVFFRDVKHLIVLGIQLWFYATPILYPVTLVPERWRIFYYLNPMAGIIEAYRAVMLYNSAPDIRLLYSTVISIVILLLGIWFFKRVEYLFADLV